MNIQQNSADNNKGGHTINSIWNKLYNTKPINNKIVQHEELVIDSESNNNDSNQNNESASSPELSQHSENEQDLKTKAVNEAHHQAMMLLKPKDEKKEDALPLIKTGVSLQADMKLGWKPSQAVKSGASIPLYYNYVKFPEPIDQSTGKKLPPLYYGPRYPNSINFHEQFANQGDSSYTFKFPPKLSESDNNEKKHQEQPRAFTGMNTKFLSQYQPDEGRHKATEMIFDSNFESGNLDMVVRKPASNNQIEYDLYMRVDTNTRGHHQWFYFSVDHPEYFIGKVVTFNIVNFTKKNSLYSNGMRLCYSKKSENGIWRKGGFNIVYKNSKIVRRYHRDQSVSYYKQLTFQFKFDSANKTYFSYCFPYTFSKLHSFVKECNLLNTSNKLDFLKEETLCKSLSGLNVPLLTITSRINSDPTKYNMISLDEFDDAESKISVPMYKRKKFVIVGARVHPGESNGSWMMQGFIKYLMGNSHQATQLRKRLVFKIIPMVNPDGVIIGNYRTSMSGNDLNRRYDEPDQRLHPTVCAIKQIAYDLIYGTKKKVVPQFKDEEIMAFVDMHGHSRKKNVFIYGPQIPLHSEKYYKMRIIPKILSEETDKFRFHSCKFRLEQSKEQAARIVMWREFDIFNCFTLEASFHGYFNHEKENFEFNEKTYEEMGEHLVNSLYEYLMIMEEEDRKKKLKEIEKKKKRQELLRKKSQHEKEKNNKVSADSNNVSLKKKKRKSDNGIAKQGQLQQQIKQNQASANSNQNSSCAIKRTSSLNYSNNLQLNEIINGPNNQVMQTQNPNEPPPNIQDGHTRNNRRNQTQLISNTVIVQQSTKNNQESFNLQQIEEETQSNAADIQKTHRFRTIKQMIQMVKKEVNKSPDQIDEDCSEPGTDDEKDQDNIEVISKNSSSDNDELPQEQLKQMHKNIFKAIDTFTTQNNLKQYGTVNQYIKKTKNKKKKASQNNNTNNQQAQQQDKDKAEDKNKKKENTKVVLAQIIGGSTAFSSNLNYQSNTLSVVQKRKSQHEKNQQNYLSNQVDDNAQSFVISQKTQLLNTSSYSQQASNKGQFIPDYKTNLNSNINNLSARQFQHQNQNNKIVVQSANDSTKSSMDHYLMKSANYTKQQKVAIPQSSMLDFVNHQKTIHNNTINRHKSQSLKMEVNKNSNNAIPQHKSHNAYNKNNQLAQQQQQQQQQLEISGIFNNKFAMQMLNNEQVSWSIGKLVPQNQFRVESELNTSKVVQTQQRVNTTIYPPPPLIHQANIISHTTQNSHQDAIQDTITTKSMPQQHEQNIQIPMRKPPNKNYNQSIPNVLKYREKQTIPSAALRNNLQQNVLPKTDMIISHQKQMQNTKRQQNDKKFMPFNDEFHRIGSSILVPAIPLQNETEIIQALSKNHQSFAIDNKVDYTSQVSQHPSTNLQKKQKARQLMSPGLTSVDKKNKQQLLIQEKQNTEEKIKRQSWYSDITQNRSFKNIPTSLDKQELTLDRRHMVASEQQSMAQHEQRYQQFMPNVNSPQRQAALFKIQKHKVNQALFKNQDKWRKKQSMLKQKFDDSTEQYVTQLSSQNKKLAEQEAIQINNLNHNQNTQKNEQVVQKEQRQLNNSQQQKTKHDLRDNSQTKFQNSKATINLQVNQSLAMNPMTTPMPFQVRTTRNSQNNNINTETGSVEQRQTANELQYRKYEQFFKNNNKPSRIDQNNTNNNS